MRAAESHSMKKNAISSLELMEYAAQAFVNALEKQDLTFKRIRVVCGVGNNGGDGFAVCRLLRDRGFAASAVLALFKETLSSDCEANKNRLNDVAVLDPSSPPPDFSDADIIIDALFGSGINKPVVGFPATIIDAINRSGKDVYSIDVPSGLLCDALSNSECIVKSTHVICFQRPKLSFFFPENGAYINAWEVVDIGLDETFIQEQESTHFLLDAAVSALVKARPRQSHKGTYGHALVMAGSYGKLGAAVLATKACLRSGAGLVSANVPKCGYDIMQISVPEALCITDENMNILTTLPADLKQYNAIGMGPGIGKDPLTVNMLKNLLKTNFQPLVLDADAINILSAQPKLIKLLPKNAILTPHIKEFDKLVGQSKNASERFNKQLEFSKKYTCIVVLKDAHTCVSSPDGNLYFNTSGNSGMATGGSGDVLTGIVTGLLAQKYEPLAAALVGVYFHGKAGDTAVKQRGSSSLIASDLVEHLRVG